MSVTVVHAVHFVPNLLLYLFFPSHTVFPSRKRHRQILTSVTIDRRFLLVLLLFIITDDDVVIIVPNGNEMNE